MNYVLDTYALMAFFWQETGYSRIKQLLDDSAINEETSIYMSRINLGEAFYIAWKKRHQPNAEKVLEVVSELPIVIAPATDGRVMEAARIKAEYPVSYADAFAIQLGIEFDATVFTDDPEFKQVQTIVKVEWFASAN